MKAAFQRVTTCPALASGWLSLLLVALAPAAGARAATLQVEETNAVGASAPLLFGYNFTNYSDDGFDWLRYSYSNSVRLRFAAGHITPVPASTPYVSQASFIGGATAGLRQQIVEDLLNDPAGFAHGAAQRHVDWAEVRCAFTGFLFDPNTRSCITADGPDHVDYDAVLLRLRKDGELNRHPVYPLILIDSRSYDSQGQPLFLQTTAGAADYWWTRWFVWRHFFIQAFYLVATHGITNFEFVNEPNASNKRTGLAYMSEAETLERATLAGDAIQRAIATANALRSPQSPPAKPNVMASAYTSWGPPLNNMIPNYIPQEFFGRPIATAWAFPPPPNSAQRVRFNSLSYHRYGPFIAPPAWCDQPPCTNIPSGLDNNIYITELNTKNGELSTTAGWTQNSEDSVDNAVAMARLLASIGPTGTRGAYPMKFGDGALYGLHWQTGPSESTGLIGGVKRAGDVVRMYAEGFSGTIQRKKFVATDDNFMFEAASDNARLRYAIWSINFYDPSVAPSATLTVDMTKWGIQPGTQVMIKEVSAERRAEVRRYYTVDNAHKIAFAQPARSVVLITVPTGGPQAIDSIPAIEDAYVRAGSQRTTNYGWGGSLYAYARASGADVSDRRVTYIKFPVPARVMDMAVLKVTAQSGPTEIVGQGTGSAVAHVYGIDDDSWSETQIKWNNAPNLGPSTASLSDLTSFRTNFLRDVGISAHVLGSITGNSDAPANERIDVSDYVRSQRDGFATFMIIREVRFDEDESGQPADILPADASLWIGSRHHANVSSQPALEVVYR